MTKLYKYIISEGDEYFDYDRNTLFELELYHTEEYSSEQFRQMILSVMKDDEVYIGQVARMLREEYGFFYMGTQARVHLSDGNEKHSKETLEIL